MSCAPTFWFFAFVAIACGLSEEQPDRGPRTLHRLAGGFKHNVPSDLSDAGLLTASAGAGRDAKQQKVDDDEEKKTLAQQVADGKYGLIQKELFSKPVKRPGIISYNSNSEVPKDNAYNLGGLNKNEIWLAENHLLVLKGGTYSPDDDVRPELSVPLWPPIDDYTAPRRQVKIPEHPKVPPPFPVQLTEGGPLQILGTNSSRTLNGSFESPPYALPPPEGYFPGSGPFFPPPYPYAPNATSGEAPFPIPPFPAANPGEYNPGDGPPPFPFPINGSLPPFFDTLPPGAVIVPPPGNQTDYDEDDPSIYYPPPYSFFYPKDNSSVVAPGPLVPGIVLPPPPDFFAPLEPYKPVKIPHRISTSTDGPKQIHPTTTPLPPTPVLENVPFKKPIHTPLDINNELKPVTPKPHVVTIRPVYYGSQENTTPSIRTNRPYTPVQRRPAHRKKPPNVTILKPVEPSEAPIHIYNSNDVIGRQPFGKYGPPTRAKPVSVSTTKIPLKTFYSTANDIDTNTVTQTPEKQYYTKSPSPSLRPTKTGKQNAQYYFYEEELSSNAITTPVPIKTQHRQNQYLNVPKEYFVPSKDVPSYRNNGRIQNPQYTNVQQPQFYYVTSRPYTTPRPQFRFIQHTSKPDSFKAHIARLQHQIQQYYSTPKPYQQPSYDYNVAQPELPSSNPVYQYSFQAANYQEQHDKFRDPRIQEQNAQDKFRPLPRYSVQIQPAVEITTKPPTQYQNNQRPAYYPIKPQVNTERPIQSQYYTTRQPDYEYDEVEVNNRQTGPYVVTPNPVRPNAGFGTTPSPIYQSYYTQQDEQAFDDRTRKYFTMFGKKLPSPTTPLPPQQHIPSTNRRPIYYQEPPNNQQGNYEQITRKPISLESDILVNYVNPRPTINPDAEYIHVRNQPKYPQVAKYAPQPPQYVAQQNPPSLRDDINVNYKQPRPPINVNAEVIQAVNVPVTNKVGEGQPGSFISYELPGDDGAHFYFLTPQLAEKREQGVVYYYSKPNDSRRIKRDAKTRQH